MTLPGPSLVICWKLSSEDSKEGTNSLTFTRRPTRCGGVQVLARREAGKEAVFHGVPSESLSQRNSEPYIQRVLFPT